MSVRASPSIGAPAELVDSDSADATRTATIVTTSPSAPVRAHAASARRGRRICHVPRVRRHAESGTAARPVTNGPTIAQIIIVPGENAVR